MNRPINHISYGPGKFEGESCIARFAYHGINDGMGEYICDCDLTDEEMEEMIEDNCQGHTHINGPLNMVQVEYFERMAKDQMCQICVNTLLALDHVDITESDQGFVYASA